jgi:hypothetical protein
MIGPAFLEAAAGRGDFGPGGGEVALAVEGFRDTDAIRWGW